MTLLYGVCLGDNVT